MRKKLVLGLVGVAVLCGNVLAQISVESQAAGAGLVLKSIKFHFLRASVRRSSWAISIRSGRMR